MPNIPDKNNFVYGVGNITPVPCKNCEERETRCHSNCERYKSYRNQLEEKRNAIIEAYHTERLCMDHEIRSKEKGGKRRGAKPKM